MPVYNGRIEATWVIGNTYSKNKNKFYGAYPYKLDKRIIALFPDCPNIMHLFSGIINDGNNITTFDINPELNPTICDNVKNIKNYEKIISKMDLIMADPPYDKSDFKKYGYRPFSKKRVIRDLASIMRSGSFLTWLDTREPMYRKDTWKVIGNIAIRVSTNHRIRNLSLFQKR